MYFATPFNPMMRARHVTSSFRLHQAVCALRQGQLIAYPTEGVWGLGCDPNNLKAVIDLLKLKNRSISKGLILVAASINQLQPYLDQLDEQQRQTLEQSWPGPHTWLIPCNKQVPEWISGGQTTVALRVSLHPAVIALCSAFGGPIVSTSANLSGHQATLNQLALQLFLGKNRKHVTVLPGFLTHPGRPSSIRDLMSGNLVRV